MACEAELVVKVYVQAGNHCRTAEGHAAAADGSAGAAVAASCSSRQGTLLMDWQPRQCGAPLQCKDPC